MKTKKLFSLFALAPVALLFTACVSNELSPEKEAQMSHDGLVRVTDKTRADVVYVRPGVDLSGYTKVMLEEPEVAFRRNWQQNYNFDNRGMNRLTDKDVEKMRRQGQELFMKEFAKGLEKGGWQVVDEPGEDVLLLKPSLTDLYIIAPDPNNNLGVWNQVYAESFGDMTLYLELYDSVTHQILVRAEDEQRDIGQGAGSWRMPRNRTTNIADASLVFRDWANTFVRGFEEARQVAAAQ